MWNTNVPRQWNSGFAVVDFHRERQLRTVPDKNVSAGIKAFAPIIDDEVCHILHLAPPAGSQQGWAALFMAMHAGNDPIGECPSVAHLTHGCNEIVLIDGGGLSGQTQLESLAEEIVSCVAVRRARAALKPRALLGFFPPDGVAYTPELLQHFGVHEVDALAADTIDTGPSKCVAALVTGSAAMVKAACGRQQRHPAVRGIQISGRARFREVPPGPGMNDARRVEMPDRVDDSFRAVIVGVLSSPQAIRLALC